VLLLIVVFIVLAKWLSEKQYGEKKYSEVRQLIQEDKVKEVRFSGPTSVS